MRRYVTFITSALSILVTSISTADDVDYLTQVKPLLSEKCYSCHGALKQESGLRLETLDLMLLGGDSGPILQVGKPEASLLLERITAEDAHERMPPPGEGSALLPDQVALISQWIEQGSHAPKEMPPPAPRDHWAFQTVKRPEIPFHDSDVPHPIDALLESKRADKGIRTQPAASRSIRIRRLYLDLIGLPPTRDQLNDDRPWGEIVDDLLASPHHGERWARHWMDIWRYCDWYGLGAQLRFSQKHLWHWRDWIVDSLNKDKGYDQMILEMLAGDELAPEDPEVIAGTGYLARNYYLFNRTTWLDTTIEHTSKAFLGLTLNCAKCHDHKYDPVTQEDYYRFRAIFEPHQVRLDPIPGVNDFEKDGLPRVFDDHVDLETYLHVRGDPKNPDRSRVIKAGVPALLASFAEEVRPIPLPVSAYAPGARPYVQADRLKAAQAKVKQAEQELARAKSASAKQRLAQQKQSPDGSKVDVEPFEFNEDFEQLDRAVWQVEGDGWQLRDGILEQTVSTREKQQVRLLKELPRDFELNCRYTTTGGGTYKSVTFRFDQTEQGDYSNYVYTSAHAPGPKVQVAYERSGKSNYPPQGRRSQPIKVGQPYHLRFAIKNQLVNVWLDGEFMVAYRYPDRRRGWLSISGFDATVAIDSLNIRSLEESTKLQESKNKSMASETDAASALKLAELKLSAANAHLQAVRATIAADNARFHKSTSGQAANQLAATAARLQAIARIADAKHDLASGDAKQAKAAQKELASAEQALAAMEEGKVEPGKMKYEPIRGARKALESPAHKEPDYPATYATTSTGRRLALARWIATPENPLTARVAVNQVWLRHFGSPLVDSVFDFGLRSKRPLHAELLDWLACEFMDSGWSFQHLHRLIVTSQAYQLQSSTMGSDPATIAADPTNRYYWRMNSRRMESQVVRDSLLVFANKLDSKVGGPSIAPGPSALRRSLYFQHSPDQQDKFLEMFDNADVLQCYRRSESIVPQQALALSNSKLSIEMSESIEQQIFASLSDKSRSNYIEAVFLLLLGRNASPEERQLCSTFFDEMNAVSGQSENDQVARRVRVRFVHTILNHNDFITIR